MCGGSRHDSSFRDHALSARQASTAKPTLNEGQMSISGAEQRRGFPSVHLDKSGEGHEAKKKKKKNLPSLLLVYNVADDIPVEVREHARERLDHIVVFGALYALGLRDLGAGLSRRGVLGRELLPEVHRW